MNATVYARGGASTRVAQMIVAFAKRGNEYSPNMENDRVRGDLKKSSRRLSADISNGFVIKIGHSSSKSYPRSLNATQTIDFRTRIFSHAIYTGFG